mmetsp:Transcript_26385/g.40494  ORF Transcript_26385/g.40494 Transcript_26385/m.40494 type:complete len:90 (+) Transcript_26385:100-369(+)
MIPILFQILARQNGVPRRSFKFEQMEDGIWAQQAKISATCDDGHQHIRNSCNCVSVRSAPFYPSPMNLGLFVAITSSPFLCNFITGAYH